MTLGLILLKYLKTIFKFIFQILISLFNKPKNINLLNIIKILLALILKQPFNILLFP